MNNFQPPHKVPDDLFPRLGQVETDVATLRTEVHGITNQLNRIATTIDDLARRQHSQGKVNWPLMVGFLTMTFGGMVIVGYVARFYVESEVRPLQAEARAAEQRAELESVHFRELLELKFQLARQGRNPNESRNTDPGTAGD